MGESILRGRLTLLKVPNHQGRASKGNQVNIPEPDFGMVAATLESLETLAVVLGRVIFSS